METTCFHTGIFPLPLHASRRHEIRRTLAYIERNFARSIALDELAAVAGLSLFRFIKLFRREIGLPPHRYHSYVRIQIAQKLMLEGLPVAEIASEVGFCDQSHLNRHFKAFCGVTPGAYMKSRRDGQKFKFGPLLGERIVKAFDGKQSMAELARWAAGHF